ncbi:hypothetical protein TCAL_11013 [Tigriopus californicus]|uniref:TIR domain-containing protein n=1 Tax=Tigriopus californicus TaxID=6832 RepID=A0A553NT02_TIGCA|nr:protein toll-like [Tigriopus californicus]TRY68548.1 hypothetical protein TCAL_11013 [Tigriopus californicus]
MQFCQTMAPNRSTAILCLFFLLQLSILQARSNDPSCPIVHPDCDCEKSNGGHDIWCPDRREHDFQIHIKVRQAWIRCNPNKNLNEDDLMLTMRSIQLQVTDSLAIETCPILSVPYSNLVKTLNITNLKELRIFHTNTRNQPLQGGLFRDLPSLTALKLQNLFTIEYDPNTFEGLESLKTLSLSGRDTRSIPQTLFEPLINLEYLDLFESGLKEVPEGLFANTTKLKYFSLSGRGIQRFPPKLFEPCELLVSLSLKSISLPEGGIPTGLFDNNAKLRNVTVYGSGFEHAPDRLFENTSLEVFEWSLLRCLSSCNISLGDFVKNVRTLKEFSIQRGFGTNLTISETFFANCTKLRRVEFVNVGLHVVPNHLFRDNYDLEHLDLTANALKDLPDMFLHSQTDLKYLDLSGNNLVNISRGVFSSLRDIRELNLGGNQIAHIDSQAFFAMSKLETLNLTGNQIAFTDETIPEWTSLTKLKYVDLSHNKLTFSSIPDEWRLQMTSLKFLNLSYNAIGSVVDASSLNFLSNSVQMDLRRNNISGLDFRHALNLPIQMQRRDTEQHRINLNKNPIKCDCHALDLAKFVRHELSNKDVQSWYEIQANDVQCSSPPENTNEAFDALPYEQFYCEFPSSEFDEIIDCPEHCQCYYSPYNQMSYVNCKDKQLEHIPRNIPALPNMSVSLNLGGNNLTTLTPLDETFQTGSISILDLSNNSLKTLAAQDLPPGLLQLSISNNFIQTFDVDTLTLFKTLIKIELGNNQFECSCDSKLLIQFSRRYQNLVNDIENVTIVCDGVPRPILDIQIHELCYDFKSDIVNIALPIVIIVLIASILALICIVKQDIIIIWIYSQPRLRVFFSEDLMDRDRPYDAFISYSNEDKEYVEGNLVPQLESNSDIRYKCCIHCRDFNIGLNISEQIKEAVDNSRRTIIVLSKHFVKSSWCEEEFNMAHKRKKVILVVYGDLPDKDDMGVLLQNYLKSYTYLKHDDPWFWEKLKFRLPHRGSPRNPFSRKRRTVDQVQLIESNLNGQRNQAFEGSNGTIFVTQTTPNSTNTNGKSLQPVSA